MSLLHIILAILRCIPFIGSFFKEDYESLYLVAQKPLKTTRKVAVIGYGVAGTATAYFLRELLGDSVELHVFSDGRVGGRTGIVKFSGKSFEAGASIIHKKNRYVSALSAKFGKTFATQTVLCGLYQTGLKKAEIPDEYLGIFNGIQFLFRSSFISILTTFELLWRYGFGLRKMQSYMKRLWNYFDAIYNLQSKGQSFTDPVAMVKAMGGDSFYQLTQVTAEDHFKQELGWGDRIVDEILAGSCRTNYGQDVDTLTAMVGVVSMAGSEDNSLYSIVGGNYQLPVKLLESSTAEVHTVHVTKVVKVVTKENTAPSFVLHYTQDEAVGQSEMWDAVVVACPLETSDLQFEGFDTDKWTPIRKQKFHRTVANFVYGKLNPRFFGVDKYDSTFPQEIFTTKMQQPAVEFKFVGLQCPVDLTKQQQSNYVKAARKDTAQVYKVFTSEPLTDEQLNLIFSEYSNHTAVDWMAYPEYVTPESFSSFVLDDGLFYVNCIECVASAMEMSCIGGKNVSLLTSDYLHKLDQ